MSSDARSIVEWEGGVVIGHAEAAVSDVLKRFGETVRRDVKDSLEPGEDASVPGEAPTDHGTLRESIRSYMHRRDLSVTVYPEDLGRPGDVPAELEYGTPDKDARPFLRPPFHRRLPEVLRDLQDSVN